MDVIFEQVVLYDGIDGHAGRKCDVGVDGDRIAVVGDLSRAESARRIDCTGLSMIPGMIDVHTHTDLVYFGDPSRSTAVRQGVTTEICSACGIGTIPLKRSLLERYHKGMAPILGPLPPAFEPVDLDHYFNALPPVSVNVATQVAHSPLRFAATDGRGVTRLSDGMQRKLAALESEAFEQGCVSVSTGLSYWPASLCDTEELFLLGNVAAKYDVPFTFHQRNRDRMEGKYTSPVQEVLDVARHTGCHVVLSHYRTYYGNCGHVDELCAPIEEALREGLRVSADFYPFEIGCTHGAGILPFEWLSKGPDSLLEQLNDGAACEWLEKTLEPSMEARQHSTILYAPGHPEFLGLSYGQIAARTGDSPARVFLRLLKEENLRLVHTSGRVPDETVRNTMERDFAALLTKRYYHIGSDSIPCCTFPHPRCTSSFVKILEIARKYGIDLSVVADRTASGPARLYGLKDRGEIRRGAFADLVVLDLPAVGTDACYTDPLQNPRGIRYVMVNGALAVDDGHLTDARSGKKLKRGR